MCQLGVALAVFGATIVLLTLGYNIYNAMRSFSTDWPESWKDVWLNSLTGIAGFGIGWILFILGLHLIYK